MVYALLTVWSARSSPSVGKTRKKGLLRPKSKLRISLAIKRPGDGYPDIAMTDHKGYPLSPCAGPVSLRDDSSRTLAIIAGGFACCRDESGVRERSRANHVSSLTFIYIIGRRTRINQVYSGRLTKPSATTAGTEQAPGKPKLAVVSEAAIVASQNTAYGVASRETRLTTATMIVRVEQPADGAMTKLGILRRPQTTRRYIVCRRETGSWLASMRPVSQRLQAAAGRRSERIQAAVCIYVRSTCCGMDVTTTEDARVLGAR
jgi:hypothetical protein